MKAEKAYGFIWLVFCILIAIVGVCLFLKSDDFTEYFISVILVAFGIFTSVLVITSIRED